jgi:4-hydroxybenzoate polyprenyltransferase
MTAEGAQARTTSPVGDALAIARYHIVLVAMVASVVFGWIFTERYLWALSLVVGVDWFLINLMNRITDIDEDLKNGIAGTERVARSKRLFAWGAGALMVGSFVVTHLVWPALTPLRIAVQLIGLGYNYRLVPTPGGLRRFKEIYFFKNFMSAALFVLTCFVYPLVAAEGARVVPLSTVIALALFFVPFELTYEILYDLRDLEGDRAEGIPTFPVIHGPETARRIIDGLLLIAGLVLVLSFVLRIVGARELLMLFAPVAQLVFYRRRLRRGLTAHDCIVLTHLGSAMLGLFLIGTLLWLRAGLPANVFFGAT